MIIATVVREHGDIVNTVIEGDSVDEERTRAWLTKELYMVEDGALSADAPTPRMAELEAYARTLGWDISINRNPS